MGDVRLDQPLRYPTKPLGQFCVPDIDPEAIATVSVEAMNKFSGIFNSYMSKTGLDAYLADVWAVRIPLAWALLSAFLIGFVYLIVLRICGKPMIYISIILIILGVAYAGFVLWQFSNGIPATDKYKDYYTYGSYTVWGIAGLLFCCVICNWKNIKIGIAVMECTAQFLG